MKISLMKRMTVFAFFVSIGGACDSPGPMAADLSPPPDGGGGAGICAISPTQPCVGYRGHGCAVDSCNYCDCGPSWGGSPTMAGCTQAACTTTPDLSGQPAGAAAWPACRDQADCPTGYACLFTQGCGRTHGVCNMQKFYCPHDSPTFTVCGCDGKTATFKAIGCEPDRPYAHAGACP